MQCLTLLILPILFFTSHMVGAEVNLQEQFDAIFNAPKDESKGISDLDSLVLIDNELGLEIYRLINDRESNLVFSPYGIATLLQMAYAGATELTQSQMARVLHFTPTAAVLKSSSEELINFLIPSGRRTYDDPTVIINNSIWVQTGHPILPDFEKNITTSYKGWVRGLDFRNKSDQVRPEINNWIKGQTKGKISDVLVQGDISEATRMLLINALYLSGKWENAFDPRLTRPMPFFPYPSKTVTLPTMSLTADLPYINKNNFTAVELNYATKAANPKLTLVLILPKETYGLAGVEASLSAQQLLDLLKEFKSTRVTISLPKFKVNSILSLKDLLEKMGLSEPFSAHADFSAIDGTQDLRVSAVFQKVSMSADEKGTDAGFATAVAFDLRAIKGVTPELFVVDHPFMFYVVDKPTGTILFLGRIIQP